MQKREERGINLCLNIENEGLDEERDAVKCIRRPCLVLRPEEHRCGENTAEDGETWTSLDTRAFCRCYESNRPDIKEVEQSIAYTSLTTVERHWKLIAGGTPLIRVLSESAELFARCFL